MCNCTLNPFIELRISCWHTELHTEMSCLQRTGAKQSLRVQPTALIWTAWTTSLTMTSIYPPFNRTLTMCFFHGTRCCVVPSVLCMRRSRQNGDVDDTVKFTIRGSRSSVHVPDAKMLITARRNDLHGVGMGVKRYIHYRPDAQVAAVQRISMLFFL